MELIGRRRRFIGAVTRGLEALLHIVEEEAVAIEQEEQFRQLATRTRQLNELRNLINSIPRQARRLVQGAAAQRIREYIQDIRIENIPADLLQLINDIL